MPTMKFKSTKQGRRAPVVPRDVDGPVPAEDTHQADVQVTPRPPAKARRKRAKA